MENNSIFTYKSNANFVDDNEEQKQVPFNFISINHKENNLTPGTENNKKQDLPLHISLPLSPLNFFNESLYRRNSENTATEQFRTKFENISQMKRMNANKSEEGISEDEDSQEKSNSGRWTAQEHKLFLEALEKHGKDWTKIQKHVKTRTTTQARSHAQKFFSKLGESTEKGKANETSNLNKIKENQINEECNSGESPKINIDKKPLKTRVRKEKSGKRLISFSKQPKVIDKNCLFTNKKRDKHENEVLNNNSDPDHLLNKESNISDGINPHETDRITKNHSISAFMYFNNIQDQEHCSEPNFDNFDVGFEKPIDILGANIESNTGN